MSDVAALRKDLEEIARLELNETPDTKREALHQLRQLISGEASLDCPTDDAFLVKFLRARKYNVERAFENIKTYFMFRRETPEIFEGLTPDSIPFDTACRKHQLFMVSRQKDPQGRLAFMDNAGTWTTDICSMIDFFRVTAVHLEHLLLDEEAQIKGVVAIFNFKGFGVYHLTQYTPWVIRKFVGLAQDCCPMRIKAIYIINNPSAFDVLFSVAKLFMKAKLLRRIHFLGYDVEKMRELIPNDLIPEENGGSLESYDYDQLRSDLQSRTNFFHEMNRCGYYNAETNSLTTGPAVDQMESYEVTHL